MQSEFQRFIDVTKIGDGVEEYTWKATPAECSNLEKRLGLRQLQFFTVKCTIKRLKNRKDIEVLGNLHANLVQECSFSLKDVPDTIQETFKVYLRPYRNTNNQIHEVSMEDEDIIEYKAMDQIDLGEVSVQYLSLAMNPYPRAADA